MEEKLQELSVLLKNMKILYVEDDAAAREVVKNILQKFTSFVKEAVDGMEALQLLEQESFDIVLTDLNMPRMNGLELIEYIKKRNFQQKIVVLSAYSDVEYLLQSINSGVDGYILKPLDFSVFFNVLYKVARYVRLERENQEYKRYLEQKIESYKKEIEEKNRELLQKLQYDTLTRLPNKMKLLLDFEKQKERYSYLIYIDIDNMNFINLNFGFEEGDRTIVAIAKKIEQLLGKRYQLYRVMSDEFAIIMEESEEIAYKLAKIIHKNIQKFTIPNIGINPTITVALIPITEQKLSLERAQLTIKKAREKKRNNLLVFEEKFLEEFKKKDIVFWIRKVQIALHKKDIVPYFQPIVDAKTKKVEKFEVLARMKDGAKTVSPFYFIPAAKVSGHLPEITKIILQRSFERFSPLPYQFSINVTEHDFQEQYLCKYLWKLSKKYNVAPDRVVLEILENIHSQNEEIEEQINEIKELGFQIAIDDFGTEGSNFLRLHSLPVDYIKIDGTFIKDIDTNQESLQIVKTIINYSKMKQIKTIAEFVHNQSVANVVQELGVDYMQGYYYGEPREYL